MKQMNPDDIPAFIDEVMATGCRPIAVANGWIVGDADLPEPACSNVQPVLRQIRMKYGERDHLVEEIAAHLRSIGQSYSMPSSTH
ncbi:hypothetical protein QWE_05783 [Agrobacterium albertimagni AOL15]|uniref:Uncharacterized protein n=1 Tax=Agrobacterium albertimagni AOL15 TaxID=1156935 RepID=K2QYB6_9HYPH|nr:hypothetical protein [Agrobacterium albertimagni]EKF60552.1 hypothetical protein QWE_05783 [Agrobacterium albertimagni AOL15]